MSSIWYTIQHCTQAGKFTTTTPDSAVHGVEGMTALREMYKVAFPDMKFTNNYATPLDGTSRPSIPSSIPLGIPSNIPSNILSGILPNAPSNLHQTPHRTFYRTGNKFFACWTFSGTHKGPMGPIPATGKVIKAHEGCNTMTV